MAEKIFKHSRHAAWRKVDGEAVILDVDTAVYYSLGGPGLRIWELLGKKTPLERIEAALIEEFDAEPGRIKKDLKALVSKLRTEKLIEPA